MDVFMKFKIAIGLLITATSYLIAIELCWLPPNQLYEIIAKLVTVGSIMYMIAILFMFTGFLGNAPRGE